MNGDVFTNVVIEQVGDDSLRVGQAAGPQLILILNNVQFVALVE